MPRSATDINHGSVFPPIIVQACDPAIYGTADFAGRRTIQSAMNLVAIEIFLYLNGREMGDSGQYLENDDVPLLNFYIRIGNDNGFSTNLSNDNIANTRRSKITTGKENVAVSHSQSLGHG